MPKLTADLFKDLDKLGYSTLGQDLKPQQAFDLSGEFNNNAGQMPTTAIHLNSAFKLGM